MEKQDSKCKYCFDLCHNLTPASPRNAYNFCPMCGEPLTEPRALTYEELVKMDGEPVFCIGGEDDEVKEWGIVNMKNADIQTINGTWNFKWYLSDFRACTHKPKED